jgi:hypothetical protein
MCCLGTGFAGAWAPGSQLGNFLPLWAKTTAANGSAFSAGDIIVHTVDSSNGNPALVGLLPKWRQPESRIRS